jgi:DNA-binding GntR family transcriptional regulator
MSILLGVNTSSCYNNVTKYPGFLYSRGDGVFVDYIRINTLNETPLYLQVADSIKKAIENGVLSYGDLLPTELELCNAFSFSRIVATMAYDYLGKEKLIERIKGKGTFVLNRPRWSLQMERYMEIDTTGMIQNQPIRRETIQIEHHVKRSQIPSHLGRLKDTSYLHIKRLFYVGRNPLLMQTCYVLESLMNTKYILPNNDISMLAWIEQTLGLVIESIDTQVGVIGLEDFEHLLLNLKPKEAAHYFRSTLMMSNNEPCCYMEIKIPNLAIQLELGPYV